MREQSAGGQGHEQPLDVPVPTDPWIDFFILADRAEAVNGKLYMMGGGWDRYFVQNFGQPIPVSFALGILVPWHATNKQYTVIITVEDVDRHPIPSFRFEGTFVTGRPPHIGVGETQRVILAIPTVLIKFENPGAYQAVAHLSSGAERRVPFRLVDTPTIYSPPI